MLRDKFILTITGNYSKEFDHYPSHEEIIEFIEANYSYNGLFYYRVNKDSKLLKPFNREQITYSDIKAKVEKVMEYVREQKEE